MYTRRAVLAPPYLCGAWKVPAWSKCDICSRDTPPQMAELDVGVVDWLLFVDGSWLLAVEKSKKCTALCPIPICLCYLSYAWCITHLVPRVFLAYSLVSHLVSASHPVSCLVSQSWLVCPACI